MNIQKLQIKTILLTADALSVVWPRAELPVVTVTGEVVALAVRSVHHLLGILSE
jgi:hypothetical protein